MPTPFSAALLDLPQLDYRQNVPLAPFTTFRLGGPAEHFVAAQNEAELIEVVRIASRHQMPIFLLGGGSNLVISDAGILGLVIHLKGDFKKLEIDPATQHIQVGSAVGFPKLTKAALDLGWETALGWHGTPGQVGGALKMNAGGRLGEIGDVVVEVRGVGPSGPVRFLREEIGFSYRNTQFPKDVILTFATLHLSTSPSNDADGLKKRALELVVRRKKTQPDLRSAGSMFKNPKGDFAGRLIEACGLKGFQIGGAQVSEVHANFLVNLGEATAADVRRLSQHVQNTVYEKFEILLEYEVKFVGEFDD